jgi:hypothetical protein
MLGVLSALLHSLVRELILVDPRETTRVRSAREAIISSRLHTDPRLESHRDLLVNLLSLMLPVVRLYMTNSR